MTTTRDERALWKEQWAQFQPALAQEAQVFERWLRPLSLDDVRGLDVLDAGCGSGVYSAMMAQAGARSVTGVDYAAWEVAAQQDGHLPNVAFRFHDLCADPPGGGYDLIVSVGVLPHVSDPERAVHHLASALRPGGRLLVWATVREGNTGLYVFDRVKPVVTSWAGRRTKRVVAGAIALATLPGQQVASRLPSVTGVLPYGAYLKQLAALPLSRVTQNFYDALNAPRRILFHEREMTGWFRAAGLATTVHESADGKSRTWIGARA